jgi:SAM-dependent methyltransferase
MHWKVKALTQMAVSHLPRATEWNYVGQKLVMRRFGNIERSVADRFRRARWFADVWAELNPAPLAKVTHFEIGAGWHLAVPLSLWCLGVERQVTVDIARLARVELVNQAIACLQKLPVDAARRPFRFIDRLEQLEDYGISYQAPSDARQIALPSESVDWVSSTLTLQHIRTEVLKGILAECRRILKPAGLFLAHIDYADNYAYTDRRITVYNFLRFSGRHWRLYNPPLHFQNRLRHVDYRRLLDESGFAILRESVKPGTARDLETLRGMRLAPEFAGLKAEDLAVRSSRIAASRKEPIV